MLFGLTLTFIASQIFATLALISGLISFQFKERKFIITFFILTAFCILLQFLLLERYVGVAIVGVGMIRYFTAYYYPKTYLIPIFISIFGILTFIFWKDSYDILAFISASLNTLGSFQKNEKYLRYFFMTSGPCLIAYNFFIGSPVGVLLETMFLTSNVVGYYRYYIRKKINKILVRKIIKYTYLTAAFFASMGTIIGVYFSIYPKYYNDNMDKIYSNILIDYEGASFEKIRYDFGIPFSNKENFEGIERLIYKMKNGTIIFGGGIEIHYEGISDIKIYLPGLYDINGNDFIILGKDKFNDICNKYPINRFVSSWGTMSEAKYTEIEYYSGWVGQYRNYIFGTHFTTGENYNLGEEYKPIEKNTEILDKCEDYEDVVIDYIKVNF